MKINAPKPWPLVPIAAVVITPVPEVNVRAILSPDSGAAKVNALLVVFEPPEVLMVVAAVRVMLEPDAPIVVGPLLVKDPAKLIALGAVAVNPALKVSVSVDKLPNCKVPVLLKVVAFVIDVLAPAKERL